MRYIWPLFAAFLLISCSKQEAQVHISHFLAMTQFSNAREDTVMLDADLSEAITAGIRFPTNTQTPTGKFAVQFQIQNQDTAPQELYYKLYYQNETYKYADESEKSGRNFYGSWKNTARGFKKLPLLRGKSTSQLIRDSIQIVGNPRDEQRYYGLQHISQKMLQGKIKEIRNTPKWYKKVKRQAKEKNISLEQNLINNAKYVLKQQKHHNLRWRRNPRAGIYSFLLVVVNKKILRELPKAIRNIGAKKKNNKFANPYSYFLHHHPEHCTAAKIAGQKLKTRIVFRPQNGIYSDRKIEKPPRDCCTLCGNTETLFQQAHYKEFFSVINRNKQHHNIPLIRNVIWGNYTRDSFHINAARYPLDDTTSDYTTNLQKRIVDDSYAAEKSCTAVRYDSSEQAIHIINQGNNGKSLPRKQNAGVQTRFGFTYGRVFGKIGFPEIINKENVWNGVTNAFWLIKQSGLPWNNRSACEGNGYVSKRHNDKQPVYKKHSPYSEIDFEIVKASKYINDDHREAFNDSDYDPALTDSIVIACTNHDLACQEPENFDQKIIKHNGRKFYTHRWYETYRAKFLKTAVEENELFQREHYFFEIGWYPDSIVWKVGPRLDQLKTVGYMDNSVTQIPDNQMLATVSQEFHHGDWWPTTPFHQNNIPYPKDPIVGKVFKIWVE